MAAREEGLSQGDCKYCKKAVNSSLKCCDCGAVYHPSCALRISGCSFKCCKPEPKTKQNIGVDQVEDNGVDFTLQAFKYLKLLVEEQTVTNKLLNEKINNLENALESEKSKCKSIEDKYNELLKKEDKKHSESDKHKKTVNQNKNITVAEVVKKGKENTNNLNLKTMTTQQKQIMSSYININSDINNKEHKEESEQHFGRLDNHEVNNENNEFKTVVYKQRRQKHRSQKNTICHGTSISEDESGFRGIDKKLWLYVYRVPRCVTESNIISYISNKPSFKNLKIDARELPTSENQNKVFLVTAPFEKKDEVYQSDFWPKGVAVKQFNFNKQRRYNQTNTFL